MKPLKIGPDESIREYLKRLKKMIHTPEFQTQKRDERTIQEWKNGKLSEKRGRQIGRKVTPGAKFHSPGEEEE